MIKIENKLRTQFAKLIPEAQTVLLKDLGFLTIDSEAEQLKMVEALLKFTESGQRRFATAMQKKLDSEEYHKNAQDFLSEVKTMVIPTANKILQEDALKTEHEEAVGIEEELSSELKAI